MAETISAKVVDRRTWSPCESGVHEVYGERDYPEKRRVRLFGPRDKQVSYPPYVMWVCMVCAERIADIDPVVASALREPRRLR